METAIIGSALQAAKNNSQNFSTKDLKPVKPESKQLSIQDKAALYDEMAKQWFLHGDGTPFDPMFIGSYFLFKSGFEGFINNWTTTEVITALNNHIIALASYKNDIPDLIYKQLLNIEFTAGISSLIAAMNSAYIQ